MAAKLGDTHTPAAGSAPPGSSKRAPRIIRRKKKSSSLSSSPASLGDKNEIPPHIRNNAQLHHVVSATLPADYEFEIPKTIWRIEKSNATAVALQLPEGLLMYASAIGDILIKFAYRFQPSRPDGRDGRRADPREIRSLSILGDVTYGACCIDDLSARAMGCDLLVHYGHSCLVPLTCTVVPCLYVFVEIRVDVHHLVDCVKLTFMKEEKERHERGDDDLGEGGEAVPGSAPTRIIEALCMGTVQFRSAVVESAQQLNNTDSESDLPCADRVRFQAVVPQAKPLSPGEVLGCTAPSGLAMMDFREALRRSQRSRSRKKQGSVAVIIPSETADLGAAAPVRERVMIFLADGRFHLEAAMISNPSLRALRYDPYAKTLTEEKYEIVRMKRLRRNAVSCVRRALSTVPGGRGLHFVRDAAALSSEDIANGILQSQISSTEQPPSLDSSPPQKSVGIILGTLGRQGNPAILSRVRSLLHSRGVRSVIVLLSEIFPKKLEMMSTPGSGGVGGVCAWVQIACPRLSIDWGHHFCVPVLSPFELFVALGEVAGTSLWAAEDGCDGAVGQQGVGDDGYPMDFYSKSGGPWANYYDSNKERKILSCGT